MSNQNVEGSNQNGDDGKPTQSLSNGGTDSINGASSEMAQLLKSQIAEALKPVLAEVRGVQGKQDKAQKGFQEFLDEYERQKAKGLSNSEAGIAAETSIKERTEAQTDKELLRKIAETVLGPSFAGNEPPAHADIVSSYGLDANDPEVIQAVLSQTDSKDAELAAARLLRKRQTQPSTSPTAASTIIATPPAPAGKEALTKQYRLDMLAAKGKPAEIRAIKDKAIQNGVDIYNQDFS
jgi:hypothetical protein